MIPWVVGIAGCSGSGKSTAVQLVADHFRADNIEAAVMLTNSYYRDQSHLPPQERVTVNYDVPGVVDLELLRKNLIKLRDGVWTVHEPRYDFKTHTRAPDPVLRLAKPVMFVDGLFAFRVDVADDGEPVLHYRLFIDTPHEICLERRIQRDIRERGRSKQSVKDQWRATVYPGYVRYVLPQKDDAHAVLPWDHTPDKNQERSAVLYRFLKQRYDAFRVAHPLDS